MPFAAIEAAGVEGLLHALQDELLSQAYRPTQNRCKAIPKGDGRVRLLGIPTIRDRGGQGALKLILEPIFEADFQAGSLPTQADGPPSGTEGGRGGRPSQDHGH
jgi:RNA-directed DNA polymerase